MNENMVNAGLPQEPEELELDLKDMLATLFLRWKTLLLCLLAGALVFAAATFSSFPRTTTVRFVTEADVFAARQAVGEDRADAIERLYERVHFYTEYLESIEQEFATLAAAGGLPEGTLVLQRNYFLTSNIDNIGSFFSASLLSEEDYDRLSQVIPEEENLRNRVLFATYSSDSNSVADGGQADLLFSVTVFGENEDEISAMLPVVEDALQNKAAVLRQADSALRVEPVGAWTSYVARDFLQQRQDALWTNYNNVDSRLTAQNNKVKALTGAEKTYYDKLASFHEGGTTVTSSGRSLKKWTAIGALLGLFAGVVLVFWPYLFDGKIKTAGELESAFRSMVLNRVSVPGKRNLFGRWAAKLTGADSVEPAIKADLVAADIAILLEKSGKKALYLLRDEHDSDASAFAEQVKARLLDKVSGVDVSVGNPVSSVEELEKVGAAELGVVFAQVKRTKRECLRRWRQICSRYRLPLAGTVAVETCW